MEENEFISETVDIVTKTALSLVPVGGVLISLIWDSVKEHSLRDREELWKQKIEERLSKLECSVECLGSDDLFASSLLCATEIAIKTAEEEKKEYLANAVVNSIGSDLNENKIMIFLNMIDKYTTWHIRVLDYFSDPIAKGADRSGYLMGSPLEPIKKVFPDICSEEGLIEKIVADLQNDGVIKKGDFLHVSMTANGMVAARTTKLGNELLQYILSK